MSLLLLLLIPVVICWVSRHWFDNTNSTRDLLAMLGATLLVILVSLGLAFWSATDDVELLSGRVSNKYKDTVSCSHSYSCNCRTVCTGSGNSRSCSTVCDTCYEHLHDYDWVVGLNTKHTIVIDRVDRQGVHEPQRYAAVKIGEPAAVEHHYTNYVKANPDSVLRRRGVKTDAALPKYPEVYDYYRVRRYISVGFTDPHYEWWNKLLAEANADLGPKKQVSITVIAVKSPNPDYEYALQERWDGGKKNELTVLLGVVEYPKIAWVRVVSWSTVEDMKVSLRDDIAKIGVLDPTGIMAKVVENVSTKYQRRHMSDFQYLSAGVEPSVAWVLATLVLVLIVCCGAMIGLHHDD